MKYKNRLFILILTAVFAVLVFAGCGANSVSLGNTVWVPLKAADASGDQRRIEGRGGQSQYLFLGGL